MSSSGPPRAVGRDVTFPDGGGTGSAGPGRGPDPGAAPRRRTPEREDVYDFTFPSLTMHGTIVVRRDDDRIRGPEDLKGRKVAVLKGDNAEEYLQRANLGAEIVPLPSFETALRELAAGRHDAVVIQQLLALQLMWSARIDGLKTVGKPLDDFSQQFCFAVRKGDRELLSDLNEGLAIVIADGTFRRLQAKWFGPVEARERPGRRIVVGGDADYPPTSFWTATVSPRASTSISRARSPGTPGSRSSSGWAGGGRSGRASRTARSTSSRGCSIPQRGTRSSTSPRRTPRSLTRSRCERALPFPPTWRPSPDGAFWSWRET
ncbi:MAG: transporter substrate-binding domain-containing protein [Holophagales bacterium]|nr:transporter substrate-binding domain-containing protein [Holophagales bacterium]